MWKERIFAGWHRVGTLVANIFLLNLLWMICCLPIITIPPSTAALFATVRGWMDGDERVIGLYFAGWRKHLKISYVVGIPTLLIACLLFWELEYYARNHGDVSLMMLGICAGFAIVFLAAVMHLGPVLVSVELSSWKLVQLVFLTGVRNFFVSIVSVFLAWTLVILAVVITKVGLVIGIVPVAAWFNCYVSMRCLQSRQKRYPQID
ncbi:YesL family protein [Alicyclobacillus acidiphilus]|uniref:YesL family protein n=1 Tax=Alicyclobacillus acidiphilus TaxID=182455 RepID=UPI00083654BA|nr:YesL family protein [Alicyclobacillus acidiphilus]